MKNCPEENFLSLRYLCNVKTNSVRNNTQKMDNKTWTYIQQRIFICQKIFSGSVDLFGVLKSSFNFFF